MRDGVLEKNQIHGSVDLVVALQRVRQKLADFLGRGHWQVLGLANAAGKMAKLERLFEHHVLCVVESLFSLLVLPVVILVK